ncbi:MAG: glycogen/starch/alpha-glucan phosphorylase [Oscillospiraceae bacterium]|nr:glycogen/starch/alpha-glucan phosphorylase [Oscillospiraceae bacterium]
MFHISEEMLRENLITKLETHMAKGVEDASPKDMYQALSLLAKDYIVKNWLKTNKYYRHHDIKQVYYFSLEFLLGKMLPKHLDRLGLTEQAKQALSELGFNLKDIMAYEPDYGLGNGGLGRLAACFMDSLASCSFAGHGIGIRYKHGLFKQKIINGYQVEEADDWLENENPWEIVKTSDTVEVPFYGNVREEYRNGRMIFVHENYQTVLAIPYDMPMMGYDNEVVNTLRLWSAEPKDGDFDFQLFSKGDYASAVAYRQSVRAISDVLYPDDSQFDNRVLRLKQQYFFVCAGIASILSDYCKKGRSIMELPQYISIHINDTHPALAVPELMRVLLDVHGLDWDTAWNITRNVISYTNHTVMPEALEVWPKDIYQRLLPRIYQITHEINERFCHELWQVYHYDLDKISRMAVEADGYIRMAHMAIVGSHSVNGVAQVHSQLLKSQLFTDFYKTYPDRFNNKTNGITHRRWLMTGNPRLTTLLSDAAGLNVATTPTRLTEIVQKGLEKDEGFLKALARVKAENKAEFADFLKKEHGFSVDPAFLFDFQVKRIHAYKRQLLNALKILDRYWAIKEDGRTDFTPTVFFFGGKAAPGYAYAKTIIKLVHSIATLVNNDPAVSSLMQVLFLENYNVSLAQRIFPAADISEQISTAGTEASGTGNMKFMLNGALTLGTMDGANIEIAQAVGLENIFTFGLSVDEIMRARREHSYHSAEVYASNHRIKRVLDTLTDRTFSDASPEEFLPIFNALVLQNDHYFYLADFDSYVKTAETAERIYREDPMRWLRMSAVNIAHAGQFSSDETIREYAKDIWNIHPTIL